MWEFDSVVTGIPIFKHECLWGSESWDNTFCVRCLRPFWKLQVWKPCLKLLALYEIHVDRFKTRMDPCTIQHGNHVDEKIIPCGFHRRPLWIHVDLLQSMWIPHGPGWIHVDLLESCGSMWKTVDPRWKSMDQGIWVNGSLGGVAPRLRESQRRLLLIVSAKIFFWLTHATNIWQIQFSHNFYKMVRSRPSW
jgi:hypothetical protein